VFLT
jgi:hypothetical protein